MSKKKKNQASIDYWLKREQEQLLHNIIQEEEYDKRIRQIYEDMLRECQSEIDAFYRRYADAEGITLAEAKKRVKKLDIARYEKKAKRYVQEKNFSKEANEEMRLYNATMKINRLEMLKAEIGMHLISGFDELQAFMKEILQDRTMEELERQAGILGKNIYNNAELAHSIVNASFHNATFSERLWQYQDLMKADLSKLLQTGLIRGKNPRVLAKEIRKYFIGEEYKKNGKKGAVYHSEMLMRTELARVQTDAQFRSYERNGFSMFTLIPLGDACDVCKEAAKKNGGHYKISEMQIGLNAPPLHPLCRCSTAAYMDSKEYEEWLDFLANGGTTQEFYKQKGKS